MMRTQSTSSLLVVVLLTMAVETSSSSSPKKNNFHDHEQHQPAAMQDPRKLQQFPELPDWATDWLNETINSDGDLNFDWNDDNSWTNWLTGLFDGNNANFMGGDGSSIIGDGNGTVCTVLETAVGMSSAFGIAAQCSCDGDLMNGMNISCSLEECVAVSDVCGTVAMNLTFGGVDATTGTVQASVCADFPNDDYLKTCFAYGIDITMGNIGQTAPTASQSCSASYGGSPCECSIENFCLQIDCEAYLPGAKMDTCQLLSLDNVTDSFNWLPNFEIFQPGFEFDADTIPWDTMNWDQIDWTNFNMQSVQWNDNWSDTMWTDLIGGNGSSESSVCSFLQQSIEMSENLFDLDGGCTCNDSVDQGLSIGCNFNDVCTPQQGNTVDVLNDQNEVICGNIELDLNFEVLAGVNNSICIDYTDGTTTPRTCFTYTIPFADTSSTPTCSATYGGDENVCECNIDEIFCIRVDCSEFGGSTAVMDSCQYVGFDKTENAQPFLLKIGGPEDGSVLADGDVDFVVQEPNEVDSSTDPASSSDTTSSELSSGSMNNSAASNLMGSNTMVYALCLLGVASTFLNMVQ